MKFLVMINIFLTLLLVNIRLTEVKGIKYGLSDLQGIERKSDVNKDLQDIINLIPKNDIEEIIKKYISSDEECKGDWSFATSDETHTSINEIEQLPEFMTVRHKLEGIHVDFVRFANMVHEIINMPPMSRGITVDNGGLRAALGEIRTRIPMTKIKLKIAQKFLLSSQFRGLIKLITNAQFKQDIKNLKASPKVTALISDAQTHGVDMQAIYDFMNGLVLLASEALEK